MQDSYRRTLATAGAVIALAAAACGSSVADTPGPTPSPVTADSVRAAFDNSTMKNAHFNLSGTVIKKPSYYPVTGDGVLQRTPREALLMNLRVQTYTSMGVLKIQEVTIGGKLYTRVGTGRWTSQRTTDSPVAPTTYVGEEIIDGTMVWHARSAAAISTPETTFRPDPSSALPVRRADRHGVQSGARNLVQSAMVLAVLRTSSYGVGVALIAAFSAASWAAVSPASCAAFSFGCPVPNGLWPEFSAAS